MSLFRALRRELECYGITKIYLTTGFISFNVNGDVFRLERLKRNSYVLMKNGEEVIHGKYNECVAWIRSSLNLKGSVECQSGKKTLIAVHFPSIVIKVASELVDMGFFSAEREAIRAMTIEGMKRFLKELYDAGVRFKGINDWDERQSEESENLFSG